MMKFSNSAIAGAAVGALIAGCDTMQGFGKDMEQGGEKIQEKAAR